MLANLRPRSVYDVLASVGFFIAVATGGAYAADTIGSADVINDSLKSEDIKNETVAGHDIRPGTIGSGRIADGSIVGSDIQQNSIGSPRIVDNSLRTGDIHDETLTGADVEWNSLTGEDIYEPSLSGVKISGHVRMEAHSGGYHEPSSNSRQFALAVCPTGKKVIGTGYNIVGGKSGPHYEETSAITVGRFEIGTLGVAVDAYEIQPTSAEWYVTVYALCANAE
jgi:hypothetical protein